MSEQNHDGDRTTVSEELRRLRKIGAASVTVDQFLGAEFWAKRAHDRGELSPELRKKFCEYLGRRELDTR